MRHAPGASLGRDEAERGEGTRDAIRVRRGVGEAQSHALLYPARRPVAWRGLSRLPGLSPDGHVAATSPFAGPGCHLTGLFTSLVFARDCNTDFCTLQLRFSQKLSVSTKAVLIVDSEIIQSSSKHFFFSLSQPAAYQGGDQSIPIFPTIAHK